MDFLILMFIIFVILGPVMGYSRYTNRQQLPPGQQPHRPQQLYGPSPYGQQPGPYGQQQSYGVMPYGQQQYQQQAPISAEAFNASKAALEDDITSFGGELRDLDLDVVGRELSTEAQADYTRALDAYDGAKVQLDRTQFVDDLKRVAEILEEGRFSVATVKARVNDQPLPEHRSPCFFDPAHGPSVEDIMWAPQGGTPRKVPACAADAQRVRLGNDPSIRMVGQPGQMVPYWDNQAYAPYAQGYYGRYGMDPAIRGLTQGALMIGGFSLLMGLFDG
ncbi:MAG: hypothetical protein GX596_13085 [Propionibacterium sp.]|nr:hypothetical protein [Propionibacterium sp.]